METNLETDCVPIGGESSRHLGLSKQVKNNKEDFDSRCESGYSVDEGFISGNSDRLCISGEQTLSSVSESSEVTDKETIDSLDEGISSINLSTEPLDLRRNNDLRIFCQNAFQQDEDGDTQLHTFIIHLMQSVSLHLIALARNPDELSIRNNYLQTPLHLAVITKQPLVVRKLISAGAELDVRDHWGNTPLHIACKEGDILSVRLILKPVTEEEKRSNTYEIHPQNSKQNLEARNYEGQVCLHLAGQIGNCEIIQELISHGANINARDGKSGRTVLHYAAESANEAMVRLLLSYDVIDVNSETYGGLTPMNLAKGRRQNNISRMLRDRGAYYYSDASSEDEMETESISDDFVINGQHVLAPIRK